MKIGGTLLSNVFLKSHALPSAAKRPSTYIATNTNPERDKNPQTVCCGMNAAIMSVYTGSRALQLISGETRIVTSLSLGLSIVRVAIMPGIAQANELSMGMNALPCRPTLLIVRSIINAARAM